MTDAQQRRVDAYLTALRPLVSTLRDEHECVFVEEQEPSGRLVLPPCLVCGITAMDALDQLRRYLDAADIYGEECAAARDIAQADLTQLRSAWNYHARLRDQAAALAALRESSPPSDAVRELADLAARAVCEPRRFHENEAGLQQSLGQAVARVRGPVVSRDAEGAA